MAIYKRVGKDGRTAHWQVVIDVDDGSGRRKRRVIGTFPTKKAAEVAHRTALTARDEGALLDKNRMTVRELLSRWLADKATTVSANTLTDYRIVVERHIAPSPLGAMQIRRVAPADIQHQYSAWLAAGASAHLVRECHMRLNQAFGFAVRMKLVAHNPVRDATPPRVAVTTFDHWTADEAKQFLEAARDDPRFAMWCVLLREGARRGEVLGLRWGDIDFDAETMRISQTVIYNKNGGGALLQRKAKTRSGNRTVRVTPTTLTSLRALKDRRAFADTAALKPAPERLIFSDEHGEPLHPHFVNRDFAKITKRAGLRPIRLHQLRHTAASLMLLAGVPVKVASQRLGHSTVAVTLNIYSHVAPELDDCAAMAMERVLG